MVMSSQFPTRKLASGGTPKHLHDELNVTFCSFKTLQLGLGFTVSIC